MSAALPVHFWVPWVDEAFEGWDPDDDPARFPSGLGHGILELYKRLARLGRPVHLGPRVARPSHVVFHLESLWQWQAMAPNRRLLRQLSAQLVRTGVATAIRGDVPLHFGVRGVTEVMPNRASIRRDNQVWVPLLPQRGLVSRATDRAGRVATAALLGYEANIPPILRSPSFRSAAQELGVTVVEILWTLEDREPRWHDLEQVDCVICVREDVWGAGLERKPATKLINTWVAGSVPIAGLEPAYAELARPDVDCLMVDGPDGVLDALARLRRESGLVSRLEEGGRQRAREFAPDRVLAAWDELLFDRKARRDAVATAAGIVPWFAVQPRRAAVSVRRRVRGSRPERRH
jgi:hypothetical protein